MSRSKCLKLVLTIVLVLAMTGCATTNEKKPETRKQMTTTAACEKEESSKPARKAKGSKLIVIDPGHQRKQNKELEAIAPGSAKQKKKVSSGTQGRFTKVPEYQVVLSVSKQLKSSLEGLGYRVVMTRETNDVDISNQERANLANEKGADVFIRIHCNGCEDETVHGALTICPTKDSPYCKEIYPDSYALSKDVLSELIRATGANDRGVTRTDAMSGINWSKVPVTIVEMGYMTNRDEDEKLVSKDYQKQLVEGITSGIVKYFKES